VLQVLDAAEHVIARLLRENKMGTVEESSRQGDWAGDLILFSWALAERKDILRAWKRLESAPNEVKCLRNYLLFRPLAKTGGLITDDEARTLVASLTAESPLGRETIERIKGRRR
jgi:hypothetical protein